MLLQYSVGGEMSEVSQVEESSAKDYWWEALDRWIAVKVRLAALEGSLAIR